MSLNDQSDAILIERWQRRGDDGAREQLVHRYRGLVRALAARYVNWGEPFDDLVQVAWIGLLKAIERYDPERGVQFPTYATPTIVGEIRRYYRDRAWAVHVPRSVQELRVRVNATIDQWSAEHGEAPTTAELAQFLDVSPDAVLDAIHSENARSALTLPSGEDDRTASGFDVPTEERGFEQVDASILLAGGLESLAERERQIVVDALRGRPDAVADRRPHRHLADARLAPAAPRAGAAASVGRRGGGARGAGSSQFQLSERGAHSLRT